MSAGSTVKERSKSVRSVPVRKDAKCLVLYFAMGTKGFSKLPPGCVILNMFVKAMLVKAMGHARAEGIFVESHDTARHSIGTGTRSELLCC